MIQFTELSEEQRERVIGSIVEKIKVVGTQETQPPFTPNNRESYSFELHNCSVRVYFVEQGPDWQEDTFVSIKEKFGRPEHLKLMGSGDYCGGIHAFYRGNSQGLVDAVLTNFSFYVPHISGARRLLDRGIEAAWSPVEDAGYAFRRHGGQSAVGIQGERPACVAAGVCHQLLW